MITHNKTSNVKEGWRVKLYLVEGPDCSISQGCFGRAAEELQHCRTTNTFTIRLISVQHHKDYTHYTSLLKQDIILFFHIKNVWGVGTDQTQRGPAPWQCSWAYGQWQRQPHTPPSHSCSSGSSQWSQTRGCHDWERKDRKQRCQQPARVQMSSCVATRDYCRSTHPPSVSSSSLLAILMSMQ